MRVYKTPSIVINSVIRLMKRRDKPVLFKMEDVCN